MTLTNVYTAPVQAIVSTITACNQINTGAIRISVAVAGAADDPKQYVVYDVPLRTNETQAYTLGITLSAGDIIRCYSNCGCVSFNIFGVELA